MVAGGVKRKFVYDGQFALSLDADLEKLVGWHGATAHASGFGIHGRGPSADLLGGNLMDISNIEARPGARLDTLWLEQSLFDDRLTIRAGQILADGVFAASDTAAGLINGTFGWPTFTGANVTQGGPAYPLSAPGVRVRANPRPDLTVLAGLFAANPGGAGCGGDPQICNKHGTTFSLSGGALWIAELQYAANAGKAATGLPGSYKLGAWRETGSFPDQLTGATDKHGDYGIYAIADQMVWRRPGTEDQGLSLFLRAGWAPEDRNFVSWYVDGGVGFKGPIASRPDDVVTLGVAYGIDQRRRRTRGAARRAADARTRPRGGDRAQLHRDADAVVDAAARPAIRHPSRRQRTQPTGTGDDRRRAGARAADVNRVLTGVARRDCAGPVARIFLLNSAGIRSGGAGCPPLHCARVPGSTDIRRQKNHGTGDVR